MSPDGAGIGGGLPYIEERSTTEMVAQELPHSCQVACARQLLRDAGVEMSEAKLLQQIGHIPGYGTLAESTARVMSLHHPRFIYEGGAVDITNAEMSRPIRALSREGAWIASLWTLRRSIHAVIVDRIEGDAVVVRDPWGADGPGSPHGTQARLEIDKFIEHWTAAFNNAVIIRRPKEVVT